MSWQVLVLLNAFFVGISMIVMRVVARDKRNDGAVFAINAAQFLFLWLAGLALVPQLGQVDSHVLTQYGWRFIGGGLAFAITNASTYKTLTYVDAAVGSIFNTLNALFTVGMAALFLHEDLSAMQVLGTVILMSAIIYSILALRTKNNKNSRSALLKGLLYALIAGVFYGIAIVNEKSLLHQMTAASYVVYGWGWQMLASFGVAAVCQPTKFKAVLRLRTLQLLAVMGVLRGVGGAAFVLAQVRSNNVALVTVIANFKLIIVIVLGAWLLKERQKLQQKTFGAIAAMAGLSIMFWK